MSNFPVVVSRSGTGWRAARNGPSANADLLALLSTDADAPTGFRVTRGDWTDLDTGSGQPLTERQIEVDQTNDSWIVGERIVIKWVTEPLVGPHPAPERLQRLQRAGFTAMPRLRGLVEWETPAGDWVPVATAVDLVPEATDGWTWCVDAARVDLGLAEGPPIHFATALGSLTAAMHVALADSPTGPIADHGDFHVGQVLRTPGGDLYVIDFDGNPTLTPTERVKHRPAAYDVAGMLVSLENVGHVVEHHAAQDGSAALDPTSVVAWTDRVWDEFLTAYREVADALLDEELLPGFVLDQIQRELAYADSHLPAWRYAPEAALKRRGLL